MDPDFEIAEVMQPGMIRIWRLHLLAQERDRGPPVDYESVVALDSSAVSEVLLRKATERENSDAYEHKSKSYACADIAPPTRPPPWSIGFSRQFQKDTSNLDRKLLGRVLIALEDVSTYPVPLRPHGDTFKPLSGEMSGHWRYRIGDHRLILQPDVTLAQINVLQLEARGSVYD